MPSVLVVNNYPGRERVERLETCIRENGATVVPSDWSDSSTSRFGSCDGVVLSGSPEMMSREKTRMKFQREIDALIDTESSVLGVCFGHQLMARAFGAGVVKDSERVYRMVKTEVLAEDPLFKGLPRSLMLFESRSEVVKSLPAGFRLVAKSARSSVAAMKHVRRPLYGVQFHPERFTIRNPEGKSVVGNFVRLLG